MLAIMKTVMSEEITTFRISFSNCTVVMVNSGVVSTGSKTPIFCNVRKKRAAEWEEMLIAESWREEEGPGGRGLEIADDE